MLVLLNLNESNPSMSDNHTRRMQLFEDLWTALDPKLACVVCLHSTAPCSFQSKVQKQTFVTKAKAGDQKKRKETATTLSQQLQL